MRSRWAWRAAMAGVLMGVAGWAHGTVFEWMDLDGITEGATVIVRATCLTSESYQEEDGQIFTLTRVQVTEPIKGEPPAELEIRTPGGAVPVVDRDDGLMMMSIVHDAPRFTLAQESVLFLWNDPEEDSVSVSYQVVGLRNGKFDVDEEGMVAGILPGAFEEEGGGVMPVEEFVDKIRTAMAAD